MQIRPERPNEHAFLHGFVREAFAAARHADGDEAEFVDRLRASGAYIPELAQVAERGDEILGHIMLTRLNIATLSGAHPALLLAPLSVRLDSRGQGVGARLVRETLERAAGFGAAVFLVGDPGYYARFGFVSASRFGVANSNGFPDENFMALALTSTPPSGLVRLPD